MLAQATGGTAFYLICATVGLVILGMAVNEWRRYGTADYQRIAVAAGVLALGRMVGLFLLPDDMQAGTACQEWALESLTLTLFIWACPFDRVSRRQPGSSFLLVSLAIMAGLMALCLLDHSGWLPTSLPSTGWPALLLLLSGFGLLQWARHRQRSCPWLGTAFLVSLLGAGGGLLRLQQAALLAHLAVLLLFAIETYHTILVDLCAYGSELQTISELALRQTQDLAFVLEVGQAITASLDLTVVLERISEAVARAVNADWAYVLLSAGDRLDELVVAARYSWWGRRWVRDNLVQRRVAVQVADFSLLRHAMLRQRQVLANQPAEYEQFERLHRQLARPQSGPTLLQPIYAQERPLGALLLGRVGSQRTFTEADGKLCQALATQVATAVDNAWLHRSVGEQARRLAQLLRTRDEEATQRQAILESITDGVVVAGEAGEVVLVNAAAEQILGIPRQRLIGQTIGQLYAPLVRTAGRGNGDQAVFEWDTKSLEGSMAPVKMHDGTSLGHVAVFRDVTREQESEQAKSQFVATISHELRRPLTSVKGYLELLLVGAVGKLDPKQHHILEIAHDSTERMISLADNLVAGSEIEREVILIQPRPVDMKSVIREAVQAVRSAAAERQLTLTVNLPLELKPAKGDPQRLRQIVDNLLDNALRYTPAGGRITVWATEAHLENGDASLEHCLVVNIRDSGVGIPAEEHSRIFERFYRVDNPLSPEARGTGMGLAIVKSLVQAHGGHIWVESTPGVGSTFSFTIPSETD